MLLLLLFQLDSLLSAASPTSCCSSTTTNEGGADLNDDNSSTASGPIYVRQPGFEHHAHEVVLTTTPTSSTSTSTTTQVVKNHITHQSNSDQLNTLKNFIINYDGRAGRMSGNGQYSSHAGGSKLKKAASESMGQLNSIKSLSSTTTAGLNSKSTNKAKKKLCLMNETNDDSSATTTTTINPNYLLSDLQNVQLKPISNKSKRGTIYIYRLVGLKQQMINRLLKYLCVLSDHNF